MELSEVPFLKFEQKQIGVIWLWRKSEKKKMPWSYWRAKGATWNKNGGMGVKISLVIRHGLLENLGFSAMMFRLPKLHLLWALVSIGNSALTCADFVLFRRVIAAMTCTYRNQYLLILFIIINHVPPWGESMRIPFPPPFSHRFPARTCQSKQKKWPLIAHLMIKYIEETMVFPRKSRAKTREVFSNHFWDIGRFPAAVFYSSRLWSLGLGRKWHCQSQSWTFRSLGETWWNGTDDDWSKLQSRNDANLFAHGIKSD